MKLPRILTVFLLVPTFSLAATTMKPGDYRVPKCDPITLENCTKAFPPKECHEASAVTCVPFIPVVPPCPDVPVSQSPSLLPVQHSAAAAPAVGNDVGFVAPVENQAAPEKKLKTWHKWAIGVGAVVLGAVIEHQFDNDDGGDEPNRRRCHCHGYYCD